VARTEKVAEARNRMHHTQALIEPALPDNLVRRIAEYRERLTSALGAFSASA
jgi:hypothetical protein